MNELVLRFPLADQLDHVRRLAHERVAGGIVRRHLAGLEGGRVELVDPTGRWEFGRDDTGSGLVARIRVCDPRMYAAVAFGGSIGAGESYMDGLWSADDLVATLRLFARNTKVLGALEQGVATIRRPLEAIRHAFRPNTVHGSRRNIAEHYDLGNELFALFLDETMMYSSALYPRADATLREAQEAKLDRICRKLGLAAGDHVVEIGTGWGGFAIWAASRYGVRVTTTTISREQHEEATRRVRAAGLEDRVTVLLSDYRKLAGRYDKLVSIEMIEAVGHDFLPAYFGTVDRLLKPDGVALIQAIVIPDHRYAAARRQVDFIQRFVFPGSEIPSLQAMADAWTRSSELRLVHLEDLTAHYVRTLAEWRARFLANVDAVRALGYPARFVRMWDFYLAYCEAGFAERYTGDVQIVLEKPGARRSPILGALG